MRILLTRRELCAAGIGALLKDPAHAAAGRTEQIIDIHQHTHYARRADETLIEHQRTMGVTRTVLLPAGSQLGLDVDCYGNDSVLILAREYPKEFVFFANEVPNIPEAKQVLEKYLKKGACGI